MSSANIHWEELTPTEKVVTTMLTSSIYLVECVIDMSHYIYDKSKDLWKKRSLLWQPEEDPVYIMRYMKEGAEEEDEEEVKLIFYN
jgi:hypothetical protein